MNIDPHIQWLVRALEKVPGIFTHSSCEGHHNPKEGQLEWGKFVVDFSVSYDEIGWEALERVTCFISGWRAVIDENISLIAWYDDGLRWSLEGEYADKDQIDALAEIVEEMEFNSNLDKR